MKYLNLYKHLLPRGRAWSIIVDKPLRRFFKGLSTVWEGIEEYLGAIYFDLFVDTTRALDEWDTQFGFTQQLGTASRLERLSSAWKASGGQSPRYIQDTLQAAGFDVYVHEWWEPEFVAGTAIEYDAINYMPSPFDPEGWWGETNDVDGTITNITIGNPSGRAFMGLAEQTGAGVFIIATNTTNRIPSVLNGEKVYGAMLCKSANFNPVLQTYIGGVGGTGNLFLDLTNKTANTVSGFNYTFTELGNDSILVQTEYTVTGDQTDVSQDWILRDDNNDIAPIGSQLYVQAAFFGKADDFPARIISPLPNPNYTPPPNLTVRNPLLLLADDSQDIVYFVECGEPLAECGEPLAQAGQSITPVGFPLVNKISKVLAAGVECGEPLAQAGEPLAQCGEIFNYRFAPRTYDIPTDPALWPYFLYIGGETFGTTATVDTTRRQEFERLCLKICPLQLWLGMLITYE